MDKSKVGELNKRDVKDMLRGGLVWLSPVILMYLSSVLGTIQQDNHVFSWNDFVPTTLTMGGLVAWFIGRFQDLLLKLREGK